MKKAYLENQTLKIIDTNFFKPWGMSYYQCNHLGGMLRIIIYAPFKGYGKGIAFWQPGKYKPYNTEKFKVDFTGKIFSE